MRAICVNVGLGRMIDEAVEVQVDDLELYTTVVENQRLMIRKIVEAQRAFPRCYGVLRVR